MWRPLRENTRVTGGCTSKRHLICRLGMDKLIPFERIKSRSWLNHIQNFGVILLTQKISGSVLRRLRFSGLPMVTRITEIVLGTAKTHINASTRGVAKNGRRQGH